MMQSALFEPQNLPELPQPSLIEHYVFESPLPIALVCIALGILVFGSLRHNQRAKQIALPTLLLSFVLAGAVMLTAQLVITDREVLKARSAQLVLAALTGDQLTLRGLLDEQVRIKASFVTQVGRDRIVNLATLQAAPMIESASTKEVRAGIFGPLVARTHIKVKIKADMIPPSSWWLVDWTRPTPDSTQWVATHIEPIWIQGFTNP